MEKTRVGIIFGGRSGEHEVSLLSAKAVIEAIDKEKYQIVPVGVDRQGNWWLFQGDPAGIAPEVWVEESRPLNLNRLKDHFDFALPVVHGTYCEDGTMQGLFEMLDIPYAGCGVLSSALCMDKGMAKNIFVRNRIPTCLFQMVYAEDLTESMDSVIAGLRTLFPGDVFVKPANGGSSVGISKAHSDAELREALLKAARCDRRILVEEAVDGRECETGVIGNFHPEVAAVGEIVAKTEFYYYNSKYSDEAGTELHIPADLSPETTIEIKTLARKIYQILDCSGFARIDFFVDRKTGKVLANEVNTIPGFTKHSMFPLLWQEAGIGFSELIDRIVEAGYERYHTKNNWETVYRG